MSSLIKTGLFGGTFNPIHNAHLRVAERAYSQFQLDRVIFIPSKIPPHKQNSEIPSAEDRYQMVKLAINSHDNLDISRVEINRPGPS
ncbi:MAG: nicotinate-nicotinamide nucleotide adenylyltransferase, partial [Candidatus Acetothermia bacterium]